MRAGRIAPSMMCVDFSHMEQTVRCFEEKKIELLHIDIMDGEFVPNYTLGTDFCERLRRITRIPLDLHLMIVRPDDKLDWFHIRPGEYVSVHWETTPHIPRVLEKIRGLGAKPILALNPATPLSVMEYVIDQIEGVLIMTVNPGFAGQKLLPATLSKIAQARTWLKERGREDALIEVDGNVSFDNAAKMRAAGADIFVAGSSSVFSKEDGLPANIDRMREKIR